MPGGGQFPQGRPNFSFPAEGNVQARFRSNSPNVYDGFSDLPPPDRTRRYLNNSPGRFNFYSPSDERLLSNDNPLYEIDENKMFQFSDQNDDNINPLYGDQVYPDQTVDMGNFLRPRDPRLQTDANNRPPEEDPMEVDELVQSWIRSPRSPAGVVEQLQGSTSSSNVYENPASPNNAYRSTPYQQPPGQDHYQSGPSANSDRGSPLGANVGPIDPGFLQDSPSKPSNSYMPSWSNKNVRSGRRPKIFPPARFSPVQPSVQTNRNDNNNGPSPELNSSIRSKKGVTSSAPSSSLNKRGRTGGPATSRQQIPVGRLRLPPMNFAVQNVKDLVAALRSDRSLFKAEIRKDGAREPRVPGDLDRYFAPRKGDIIVHSAPTDDADQKLVEYFDGQKTLQRVNPGDKLVRVKYDNQRIPDHLMITCKLYVYAPEWVYLGKALQTIKTA